LQQELEKLGKTAVVCDHVVDADGETVNSTAIRKSVLNGDMEKAMEYLGRPFSIYYPVIHGRHLGTEIGVPTVNQSFSAHKLKPKNGVYACVCTVGNEKYCGVANVGTKPTVTHGEEDAPVLCETHIINYSGNLYGQQVKIEFYRRLRDEKRFSSLDELVAAVQENIRQTKLIFADREDIIK
jgi:riboflavin kinase/FMN adenylyltransferase